MRARTLSAELGERFSRFIEQRLGLFFPPSRQTDLERGVRSVATELGFESSDECADWLLSSPLTGSQTAALAAHLTIGETYFFRDPRAFGVLETEVLPSLLEARRNSGRRLRIWSAGCCTGEETYSIAIAVSRALPDLHEWQIAILGTDLNPRFLRKAAAGVYSPWSFRGVPDAVRSEYFQPAGLNRFEILPEIRRMVSFECVNLVEDAYPSLATATNAMDVIFCRNVMIYFSRERARSVARKLHGTLVEGGWLFTSAVEASQEVFEDFTPAGFSGTAVFRRMAAAAPTFPSHPAPSRTAAPPLPPTSIAARPLPASSPEATRRLANEGRLDQALRACEDLIATDKLAPESHYLHALVLQEHGLIREAAVALRRALFLDPGFAVAHFALGGVLQRLGRTGQALRSFENVRIALRGCEPAALLPSGEGLTAGRLLSMITAAQESAV